MYGLLLESLSEYVKTYYGEEKWDDIRRQAGVDAPSFSTHQVYPENLLNKLAKKAQQILCVSERDFMDQLGVYFVSFVSQYGYDRVLSVLGRHMRDFLNGLDNLHEYLKFSYPRMRAPSFICENENEQGLTLHYRSKRRGFVYYTMGQIREVSRIFYNKDLHIELIHEEILFDTVHVTFQLSFDNRAFTIASLAIAREEKHLPISANVLFEIFPFSIVFGSDMIVRSLGNSLMLILPELLGKKITAWFDLVRPLTAFKFETILIRTNNIFELVTLEPIPDRKDIKKNNEILFSEEDSESEKSLHLKGQMIYMYNWRMIMFLGTPVMPDLTSLIHTGLYINDLSMHDFSRDLMLAGTQQSVELKLALDQEQLKSKKLEESMKKLDEEMKRTDELLYQMIPKQVADRLRRGANPVDTCEMFDSVSILFSDVVTFTEICCRITPMEVVSMLNAMYSIFDTLTERNRVYKVETIGDAYMVVAGAPERDPNHAEKVCDMALDMVDAITDLKDPSTGQHLSIRVGVHSGAVVAGIVGLKMPRYCLFGDSVNTASRMESTSTSMKIHISETTKEYLGSNYKLTERGEIELKGKGSMKTYWLIERECRKKLSTDCLHRNSFSHNLANKITTLKYRNKNKFDAICDINHNDEIMRNAMSSNVIGYTSGNVKGMISNFEDRRRIYSPVTFKDLTRCSVVNSPIRNTYDKSMTMELEKIGREIRSNSMGHVYKHWPVDFFRNATLNNDTNLNELLEDNIYSNQLKGSTSYILQPSSLINIPYVTSLDPTQISRQSYSVDDTNAKQSLTTISNQITTSKSNIHDCKIACEICLESLTITPELEPTTSMKSNMNTVNKSQSIPFSVKKSIYNVVKKNKMSYNKKTRNFTDEINEHRTEKEKLKNSPTPNLTKSLQKLSFKQENKKKIHNNMEIIKSNSIKAAIGLDKCPMLLLPIASTDVAMSITSTQSSTVSNSSIDPNIYTFNYQSDNEIRDITTTNAINVISTAPSSMTPSSSCANTQRRHLQRDHLTNVCQLL